jgi:hypothetical protein
LSRSSFVVNRPRACMHETALVVGGWEVIKIRVLVSVVL